MAKQKKRFTPTPPLVPDPLPPTPDGRCYERARAKGAHTFTLVAYDRVAPGIIREWAKRAAAAGAPALKVGTAMIDAARFDQWQADHGSKIPD